MKCNVPRNSSLSKIKCLSMFMCQRNWIVIAVAINSITSRRQKKFTPPSNVQIDYQQFPMFRIWLMNQATTNYRQDWNERNYYDLTTIENYKLSIMPWYHRTRIFTTPRVVELSMKSKRAQIYTSYLSQSCRRSQSPKRPWRLPRMPQTAMKCQVIINLSADILLRRLLT